MADTEMESETLSPCMRAKQVGVHGIFKHQWWRRVAQCLACNSHTEPPSFLHTPYSNTVFTVSKYLKYMYHSHGLNDRPQINCVRLYLI
jgi:hypothetical protein